jgi:hypothetical protein
MTNDLNDPGHHKNRSKSNPSYVTGNPTREKHKRDQDQGGSSVMSKIKDSNSQQGQVTKSITPEDDHVE